jgi:NAD(P)-dependent dehydrogenase (short-subunit alcohol dehydrogenase family)
VNDHLEDKVAVVTGAARGIGLAAAKELAARGAKVVLSDVDEDAVRAAAGELNGAGAEAIACDVRDEAQVTALLQGARERHGSVDVVVPNAGVGRVQTLLEMSFADWRETLAVNLDGVFLTSTAAARIMVEQGSGSIVNIASITAMDGSPGVGNYSAAKAAVVNLTKTLNSEVRGFGVRVNAVCPGFIRTDLVTRNEAAFDALLPEGMTLDGVVTSKQSRWGTPEDVAAAVCFLAGDRSSWVSGVQYVIDGGWQASLL